MVELESKSGGMLPAKRLYIANKNYSSWSLRPWVLMKELGIPFEEHLVPFMPAANGTSWDEFRKFSPSGQVPCLFDGGMVVWESLAIVEHLAEQHRTVWPSDGAARAWARSAAAEMHAGFAVLRDRCSMCCAIRVRLHEMPPALVRDLERLQELWGEGLSRFGGPFLGGAAFTAVDAFFAPVAFRLQTYGLKLDAAADAYAARLRDLPSMKAWYTAAAAERWRDPPHDAHIATLGECIADMRAV